MNMEERITAYLFGYLNETERQAFEQQLATDTALQAELAEWQQTIASLEIADYIEGQQNEEQQTTFKQRLDKDNQLQQEVEAYERAHFLTVGSRLAGHDLTVKEGAYHRMKDMLKPSGRRSMRWGIWAIAASIILVLGITFGLLRNQHSNYNIAMDMLAASPIVDDGIRGGNPSADAFKEALQYYSQGNYAASIPYFGTVSPTDSNRFRARLYLANAYTATADYALAISIFTELLETTNTDLPSYEIQWYLALAYLAQGELDQATELLHTIEQTGQQRYPQRAALLRQRIDNGWRNLLML